MCIFNVHNNICMCIQYRRSLPYRADRSARYGKGRLYCMRVLYIHRVLYVRCCTICDLTLLTSPNLLCMLHLLKYRPILNPNPYSYSNYHKVRSQIQQQVRCTWLLDSRKHGWQTLRLNVLNFKQHYIKIESENQKSCMIILLVLFHSACPYKNYCLKYFTEFQSPNIINFVCYLFFLLSV